MSETSQPSPTSQGSQRAVIKLLRDYRFFLVALGIILVDQLIKLYVKFTMHPYQEIKMIGEVCRINFIENKGAAFGVTIADLFAKVGVPIGEETAKLALTMFSIFAVIVIIYLIQQVRDSKTSLPYFLALILGGAVGNIIDRVFYGVWFAGINDYEGSLLQGRVVDMFYINLVHGKYLGMDLDLLPVFNLADAAIAVGIFAILIYQRRFFKLIRSSEESAAESTEAAIPASIEAEPTSNPNAQESI